MLKRFWAVLLFFALAFSLGTAVPVFAAGLTEAQVEAIIAVLKSFGADGAILEQVSAQLYQTLSPRGEVLGAVACSITQNLSRGSQGPQVECLQRILQSTGDYAHPRGATGYFGSVTETAVKSFQTKNGIVSSGACSSTGFGCVGPLTRAALNAISSGSSENSSSSTSSGTQSYSQSYYQGAYQSSNTSSSGVTQTFLPSNTITVLTPGTSPTPSLAVKSQFGRGVAIDGNHVAIGAIRSPSPQDSTAHPGAVFVYEYDRGSLGNLRLLARVGSGYTGSGAIDISVPGGTDFGIGVALQGRQLAIGAPGGNGGSGIVYLIEFDNDSFTSGRLVRTVTPQSLGVQADSWFGWDVALDGNQLAIGASNDAGFGTSRGVEKGAAYIVQFDDAHFSNPRVRNSIGAGYTGTGNYNIPLLDHSAFGHAVSMQGGRLLIAADKDRGSGATASTPEYQYGAVFAFDVSGGTPVLLATIGKNYSGGKNLSVPLDEHDFFGASARIDGNTILVGAAGDDGSVNLDSENGSGAVHVIQFDDSQFSGLRYIGALGKGHQLASLNVGQFDRLGYGVALSGNTAIIGAPQTDTVTPATGKAFLLSLPISWSWISDTVPASVTPPVTNPVIPPTAPPATSVNRAPNTPVFTQCPASLTVNQEWTFRLMGTDPDGNTIKYWIDWGNGGTSDASCPNYAASGSESCDLKKSFPTAGMYMVRGITNDIVGADSGSVYCNVSVTAPTPTNSCASNYGASCQSASNSCGQANTGTVQCNGSCSASQPSDSQCAVYAQGQYYSQGYYQSQYYTQGYYQSYYQGSYQPSPPPSMTLTVPTGVISSGSGFNVSWSSSGFSSCRVLGPLHEWTGTSGTQSEVFYTANTYAFILRCTLPNGQVYDSTKWLKVGTAAESRSMSISAPQNVSAGTGFTASWNAQGASSCRFLDYSGDVSVSSSGSSNKQIWTPGEYPLILRCAFPDQGYDTTTWVRVD